MFVIYFCDKVLEKTNFLLFVFEIRSHIVHTDPRLTMNWVCSWIPNPLASTSQMPDSQMCITTPSWENQLKGRKCYFCSSLWSLHLWSVGFTEADPRQVWMPQWEVPVTHYPDRTWSLVKKISVPVKLLPQSLQLCSVNADCLCSQELWALILIMDRQWRVTNIWAKSLMGIEEIKATLTRVEKKYW